MRLNKSSRIACLLVVLGAVLVTNALFDFGDRKPTTYSPYLSELQSHVWSELANGSTQSIEILVRRGIRQMLEDDFGDSRILDRLPIYYNPDPVAWSGGGQDSDFVVLLLASKPSITMNGTGYSALVVSGDVHLLNEDTAKAEMARLRELPHFQSPGDSRSGDN